MKYVVTWENRPTLDEEAVARALQVFGKWTPSETVTYHEFLSRIDGTGGFAVVECDDPAALAKDVAPFAAWFTFTAHPVLEIAEATAIDMEAVEFVASVS
jgi:hypothetical protein